jgi:hypothetical protein
MRGLARLESRKAETVNESMRRSTVVTVSISALLLAAASALSAEPAVSTKEGGMWMLSPMVGWNRDEMKVPDRTGQVTKMTDTAPEYSLFALAAYPRFVVNDFIFFTEGNGADVMGNLFYANAYGDPESPVTWNLGAGHLYHEIKPENQKITVQDPMVKAGPLLRIKPWHVVFNPYLGYAWERIDLLHGDDIDNDSYLYGITGDWRWRMMDLNMKYYYQDSRELDENFNNVHARFTIGITSHWGAVARFDYMEHLTTDDTSFLIGPVYVF